MKKYIFAIGLSLFIAKIGLAQCACCAGAGIGSINSVVNSGGITLPPKNWVIESSVNYRGIVNGQVQSDDETLLNEMVIASVGLSYGFTQKLTISATIPYVFLGTSTGADQGLGDLNLLGTYQFYSKNNTGLGLQAGIELPTGIQKSSRFDNSTVVIGSGSFDPMLGLVFSKRFQKVSAQGNALFKYTTPGFEGNYFGSLSTQNLNVFYQIKGESNFCALNTTEKPNNPNFGLNVFGGYAGEWLDKLKEDGEIDENSGHYLGFATVGATISYKNWAFPISYSAPIINKVNGVQNKAGARAKIGLAYVF